MGSGEKSSNKIMPNDVKLQEGHPVDENLRPIKVGGEATALEVSKNDVRVNNLYVNGTSTGVSASDDTKLPLTGGAMTGAITTNSTFDGVDIATRDGILTSTTTTANAALPKAGGTMTGDITTDSDIISTGLTIDDSGDIALDAAGGDVNILQADLTIPVDKKVIFGNTGEYIVGDNTDLDIVSSNDATIAAGGDIILDAGGDTVMVLSEAGNAGNVVHFGTSCAGFTQFEPEYNATDTNVFFNRAGNKAHLTFTSASETIVDIHLNFPDVSCNCVLLILQHASGGGAVTNWKTYDQAGGNESTVVWAGGTAPTLTTGGSKIDIMSFYWDNDGHRAYGVASLNF